MRMRVIRYFSTTRPSRRPLFALELLRWKWLRIKVITVCSFDLASALIAQGFKYLLMPDFRCPERQESLFWAEFGCWMAPTGDKVRSSSCPIVSNWKGTSTWYWTPQSGGVCLMAAKYPWGLLEAHRNCTHRNGRPDFCREDRAEVCQRNKRYDHSL